MANFPPDEKAKLEEKLQSYLSQLPEFVMVVYRDADTAESKITPLEELDNFLKLMSSRSLGKIVQHGLIEQSLQITQTQGK